MVANPNRVIRADMSPQLVHFTRGVNDEDDVRKAADLWAKKQLRL